MHALIQLLPLALWAALWAAGGWLLASGLFRLRRSESAMVGLGIGLVVETWLANLTARWLPVVPAFWLAAGLTGLAGLLAALRARVRLNPEFSAPQWALLAGLTLLFTATGRGLGIFDDYQNLPTVSLMAAGDIPPHFALGPSLNFGYHYFLLLFATQLMRLGGMYPWTALDLGRGLIMALPLLLAGLWAHRLTGSRLASFLTGLALAFVGGARWLLLLLPAPILARISDQITVIGSAGATATSLSDSLLRTWVLEGGGPVPFPFAFYTGINQPYVMAYTGISGSAILIVLILLLTAERWTHWSAGLVAAVLIAALALANEATFGLFMLSFPLVLLIWVLTRRNWPRSFLPWMGVLGAAGAAALLQGGMLTEIARARLTPGPAAGSYFDATPSILWPPSIISAHFGALSLANPAQLLVALAEIGPAIFVAPLILAWGIKSLRLRKWYEAALIAASFWSLPALFVSLKGPLYTATPRLMSGLFFACILYGVPLLWIWARRRSDAWKAGLAAGGLVAAFSGLMLFGIQLIAVQKPVYSWFITPMDASMSQEYWDRLEPGALVFDPLPYRAPTVFGRFNDSSLTWYLTKPEWDALARAGDPARIHAAGFAYMYFDIKYWENLSPEAQAQLESACVQQIAQVDGIRGEQDARRDFRRLLDLRACR
jgi:hypothetical protein